MGIRLIVEVLDHWQDVGLTAGERGDLLVLAENANDKSRETWGPVHAPHILKRAGKTAASWRISINRLMKKKALEFARRDGREVRGYTGQHAVYRLVELCPEPPHDGYKGHCTRPAKNAESVVADPTEEGYPSANPVSEDQEEGYLTANPEGYLTANAVDGLGYLTATERVSGQLTPSPPVSSSFKDSSTSPSSSVAEDASEASASEPETEEGGGGGEIDSEEQDKTQARAEAFVASLAYRGKPPGQKRRTNLQMRVAAAFKAGWTERGLRRYLDISDDPNIRNAAAVYEHRLSEDELPEAVADPFLPPVCGGHLDPAAATDLSLRVDPITGDPCPDCHPDAVGRQEEIPPACQACLEENPAARTNIRMRFRIIDEVHQACPDCHPKRIVVLAAHRARDSADGGMWDRAMDRAQQRMASGNWQGAGPDERAAGWLALSDRLAAEEKPSKTDQRVGQALEAGRRVQRQYGARTPQVGSRYSNDAWVRPADPAEAAKIPHCGAPGCDPVTRLKTEPDWTGKPHTSICSDCHPALKF